MELAGHVGTRGDAGDRCLAGVDAERRQRLRGMAQGGGNEEVQ